MESVASRLRWEAIDALRANGLSPIMWITHEGRFSRVTLAVIFSGDEECDAGTTQACFPDDIQADTIARALRSAADLPSLYGCRFSTQSPIGLPFLGDAIRLGQGRIEPVVNVLDSIEWLAKSPSSIPPKGAAMGSLDRLAKEGTWTTGAWAGDLRKKIIDGLLYFAGEEIPPKQPSLWSYWNPARQEWITAPESADESYFASCIRSDRGIAVGQRDKEDVSWISVDFDAYDLGTGERISLTAHLLKEIIVSDGIRSLESLGIRPLFSLSGHGFHVDLFLYSRVGREDAETILEAVELLVATECGFSGRISLPTGKMLVHCWRRMLPCGSEIGIVRDADNLNNSVSLWTSYNEKAGRRVMPVDFHNAYEEGLKNTAWIVERILDHDPRFVSNIQDRVEVWMKLHDLRTVKQNPTLITCSTPRNPVIGANTIASCTALCAGATFNEIVMGLPGLVRDAMRGCRFERDRARSEMAEALKEMVGTGSNGKLQLSRLLRCVDSLLDSFDSTKAVTEGHSLTASLLTERNRLKILRHVLAKIRTRHKERHGFILTWALNEALNKSEFSLGSKGLATLLGDVGAGGKPDHTGVARAIRLLWKEIGILVEVSPPVYRKHFKSRNTCRTFKLNMAMVRDIVQGPDIESNIVVYPRTEEWSEARARRLGAKRPE